MRSSWPMKSNSIEFKIAKHSPHILIPKISLCTRTDLSNEYTSNLPTYVVSWQLSIIFQIMLKGQFSFCILFIAKVQSRAVETTLPLSFHRYYIFNFAAIGFIHNVFAQTYSIQWTLFERKIAKILTKIYLHMYIYRCVYRKSGE